MLVRLLLALAPTLSASAAYADDEPRRGLVYAELLGKGGPYGVGYERAITGRLSLGVTGSFAVIRQQQLTTIAPYLHVLIARRGRNALFGELGASIVHSRVPSPVATWDGMSDTGGGGLAALGYERAGDRLVFRVGLSAVAGEGGLAPWGGIAIGVKP